MTTDDQTIAQASRIHTKRPELKPLDWRVLGSVIQAGTTGLPLAFVRGQSEFLGSLPAFLPAVDRLIKAGLVERREVPYQATEYSGKAGRQARKEVVFYRTSTPITPFIL
jgi:hypothetical protein